MQAARKATAAVAAAGGSTATVCPHHMTRGVNANSAAAARAAPAGRVHGTRVSPR